MDKHLNIFWQYNRPKPHNEEKYEKYEEKVLENNITRNSLVVFYRLSDKNKINFLNNLLEKKILNENIKYDFVLELQEKELSEEIKQIKKENKFLIGFCPSGKVENCYDIKSALNSINSCSDSNTSNPDGCILVKENSKPAYAFVFENKLEPLKPGQLMRHLRDYMGILKADKENVVIKNYQQFFSLFNISDYLSEQLIEYMIMSGYLMPTNFEDALKIDYKRKDNVNQLLKRILEKVAIKGKVEKQLNWAYAIKINSKYYKMIGLVWHEKEGNIELNIKFASDKVTAKNFYRDAKANIEINSNIEANLSFANWHLHLYASECPDLRFINYKKYFDCFRSYFGKENSKPIITRDLKGTVEFFRDCKKRIDSNDNFDEKLLIEKITNKLKTKDKISFSANFEYKIFWDLKNLSQTKIEDFIIEIKSKIKECSEIFGLDLIY